MRIDRIVMGLLFASIAAAASARQNDADGNTVTGRIETIYVRESHRFFIERKLVRRTEGKELWAEVRFERLSQDDPVSELALLPANTGIEREDLVETRLAEPVPLIRGTLPEVSRVIKLVAKHDTLQAMLFGLSSPRRMQGLFAQAGMCPTNVAYSNSNPQ